MIAVFGFCFNICLATVEDKAVNTAKNADCDKTADAGVVYVCGNRESNISGILESPVNTATGTFGGGGGVLGGGRVDPTAPRLVVPAGALVVVAIVVGTLARIVTTDAPLLTVPFPVMFELF